MKTPIRLFEIFFALLCLGLLSTAQAVNPPPDGGYPGFNTAEGQNTLFSLTTGVANSAVGWFSLFSNTDGSFNTAVGAGTLLFNVGNQSTGDGTQNTAIGTAALLNNTTGGANTATGVAALVNNTTGGGNTATGGRALLNNTTGSLNTAIGIGALSTNNGDNNTAIGANALLNTIGNFNTGIGQNALFNNTTGGANIALGVSAGSGIVTASNVIAIGTAAADVSDSCFIGHIFGVTSSGGTTVFVDGSGKLGTITSSRRFKEQITSMEDASTALLELNPVIFRYNKDIDPAGTSQFGLVAEEVEKVNPDLVVRDKEGKPYSVRYDQVNAMLLNEFLKEHRRIEELRSAMAQQRKETEALVARLTEQEARIQKVSAQLELSKAAPQVVTNDR